MIPKQYVPRPTGSSQANRVRIRQARSSQFMLRHGRPKKTCRTSSSFWNGYAYGKGVFGAPAHKSLKENLKSVDVTFNKTVTDEYDLTGCCCYFGTHGGMINAARVLSGKEIQNYYGDTREQDRISVRTLTEEMRRITRGKLLNPKWIEGMKEHGYKGAGEISKRVGRVYGWQATAMAVDDSVFDDITRTFMMNEENRKFFEKNNPWALEEIARRLIEAVERDLWNPSPDVREALASSMSRSKAGSRNEWETSRESFRAEA